MSTPNLLPLEKIFQKKAEERKSEFPHFSEDYFGIYVNIVNYLKQHVYPLIDAGLASNSEESGFYTLHNAEHFDDVVKYAGYLLGCDHGDEPVDLSAYELYVLLIAIRLHDAGNAFGRERHEKRAFFILRDMGKLSGPDDFEKRFIADIAQAHGGKAPDGTKDTIRLLKNKLTYIHADLRPRLLAAITRFADEICETNFRAANLLLSAGALPEHSEVYHKYASTIKRVKVKRAEKSMSLQYAFSVEDARRTWGKGSKANVQKVFLMDEILERLEKLFLERQYCSRFMRGVCDIERVRAHIEIFNSDFQTVKEILIVNEEEGYPLSAEALKDKYSEFTGAMLQEALKDVPA
jgi:hypothetical protein